MLSYTLNSLKPRGLEGLKEASTAELCLILGKSAKKKRALKLVTKP